MLKWNFTKLSTNTYETNRYEINEDFNAICISTDMADIKFVSSEESKCFVECYDRKNLKHEAYVKEGTLVIELVDTRKWYEYIGIDFDSQKITVYIPQGEYGALSIESDTGDVEIAKDFSFESINISEDTGDVACYASASGDIKIKTTTGNIYVKDVSASTVDLSVSTGMVTASDLTCEGDVNLSVSTGKTKLSDIACKNVISNGTTGDISLDLVVAAEKFSINRSTGDVDFVSCDAAEIFVKTDTGDVEGSLLSEKVFIVNTDTGKKDVPNTITGGRCEITTDTGDIKIKIVN